MDTFYSFCKQFIQLYKIHADCGNTVEEKRKTHGRKVHDIKMSGLYDYFHLNYKKNKIMRNIRNRYFVHFSPFVRRFFQLEFSNAQNRHNCISNV